MAKRQQRQRTPHSLLVRAAADHDLPLVEIVGREVETCHCVAGCAEIGFVADELLESIAEARRGELLVKLKQTESRSEKADHGCSHVRRCAKATTSDAPIRDRYVCV